MNNSEVLNYLESTMRDFLINTLSSTKNWEKACIPNDILVDTKERHKKTIHMNNVLNKPNYTIMDFVNFDAYEKIITRKDNWEKYFATTFLLKPIFTYKMDIIRSLRNDVRHGRMLDPINDIRLKLHCYDVLAQIYEADKSKRFQHKRLAKKIGLL